PEWSLESHSRISPAHAPSIREGYNAALPDSIRSAFCDWSPGELVPATTLTEMNFLENGIAAVNDEDRAGHEARCIGCEKYDSRAELIGRRIPLLRGIFNPITPKLRLIDGRHISFYVSR